MSRIGKQVLSRLEAAASSRLVGQAAPRYALVWTADDARVDARSVPRGQYIAADVRLALQLGCGADPEAAPPAHAFYEAAITERVTSDSRDLGKVLSMLDGEPIGRVVSIDGARVEWELSAGALGVLASELRAREMLAYDAAGRLAQIAPRALAPAAQLTQDAAAGEGHGPRDGDSKS